MSLRYLIVANQSHAKFYETDKRFREFRRKLTLENPSGQDKNQDLITDKPGVSFDSGGHGQRAMRPGQSAVEKETERFAREVAHQLDQLRQENSPEGVTLIAEPQMLGLLRDKLSDPSKKLIEESIPKDIAQLEDSDIQAKAQKLSAAVI